MCQQVWAMEARGVAAHQVPSAVAAVVTPQQNSHKGARIVAVRRGPTDQVRRLFGSSQAVHLSACPRCVEHEAVQIASSAIPLARDDECERTECAHYEARHVGEANAGRRVGVGGQVDIAKDSVDEYGQRAEHHQRC